MKTIKLPASEFVLFKGTAKTGAKAGQPYAFVRLDQRISNDNAFVTACEEAGVKVITEGAVSSGCAGFEISEE